jgi:murein L,D-transpeptidase YcbB/YkuD
MNRGLTLSLFTVALLRLLSGAALAQAPGQMNASPISPVPMSPAATAPAIVPVPPSPSQAGAPAAPAPAANAAAVPSPSTGLTAPPSPAPAAAATAAPHAKSKPPIREWALSTDPTPSFQPETFFTTVKASERYAKIVDAGGWPMVPGNVGPGVKGPAVAALRKRLAAEDDLPEALSNGQSWDAVLASAVKHFQERNGLRPTGVVSGATLRALNVPANVRFRQLASSAQRLAGIDFPFGDRFVVVNIPSAAVEAVQNGVIAHRYVAVVGDVEHRSPDVQAKVSVINLNPTWTVPQSIIKNEIIPKMRKDPAWLARSNIRILDNKGQQVDPRAINWQTDKAANYTLRQDSGAHNSLGTIRIGMPNKLAVYMHDTPSKGFFGRDYRFLSHGCVRVEGVYDLAAWLLEETPGAEGAWTAKSLQAVKEREDVKLTKPVPVIWVYMTGWASADGTVHFADDVYSVDSIGLEAALR